jgi:hypothetical protein
MGYPTTLSNAQDRNAVAGTCNTNGTAVTRVTGGNFTSIICGFIEIGGSIDQLGVLYPISSITDADHLILSSSAGVQTGVYFTAAVEIKAVHLNALENKVGIDNSSDPDSLDFRVKALEEAPPVSQAWPIGSVFIAVVPTNPATLLGYGTWTAFGTGRMPVGIDTGQTEFNTVEKTGGAKTKDIAHYHLTPVHEHGITPIASQSGSDASTGCPASTGSGGAPNTSTSGSTTQDVLNPYIVVYMWKRTA